LAATIVSGSTQLAADDAGQRAALTATAAVPPATLTPAPSETPTSAPAAITTAPPRRTASSLPILTATTSPHTCQLTVSRVNTEPRLLVVGRDWPPNEPLYLTGFENDMVSGWPHWRVNNQVINQTGNAGSDPPFGFSLTLTYQEGRANYTLMAGGCTAQFSFP
jgi:hypothetical protein